MGNGGHSEPNSKDLHSLYSAMDYTNSNRLGEVLTLICVQILNLPLEVP